VDETSQWNIQLDEYFLFNNQALASATNNIMRIAMDDNSQKDIMADFALKELDQIDADPGKKHGGKEYC
jgi:hypothetical protein